MKSLFLFMILFCLVSCSKESNNNNIVGTANDSIYISSILGLDVNFPPPNDTAFKIAWKYDNQHRVTDYWEINNYPGDTTRKAKLFYNGSDSMPYLATMVSGNFGPDLNSELHFFTFSPASPRQLIYDSTLYTNLSNGSAGLEVRSFTYYNDSIIVKTRRNGFPSFTDKYLIIKQNGNILFEDDGWLPRNQQYDSRENPLSRLKFLLHEHFLIGAEINERSYLEYEKNNLTEINNENRINIPSKFKYTYIYNANGHPYQVVIQNLLSTPQRPNLLRYFYTR